MAKDKFQGTSNFDIRRRLLSRDFTQHESHPNLDFDFIRCAELRSGHPKVALGRQVSAIVMKRPPSRFAIHDPILSAFLGDLGALAVNLSSKIQEAKQCLHLYPITSTNNLYLPSTSPIPDFPWHFLRRRICSTYDWNAQSHVSGLPLS